MAFFTTLLQRFGLFAQKSDADEYFGNRLNRIGTREKRRDVRARVFVRPLPLPLEDAALA